MQCLCGRSADELNIFSEPAAAYGTVMQSDVLSLVQRIRTGVSYRLFEYLSSSVPFRNLDWSAFLHISESCVQRHKKGQ
jgi:hypothetical protein